MDFNEELFEFLCYDKILHSKRLELESMFFKYFMKSRKQLDIEDLLEHINNKEYLVEILNVSRKNNIKKETKQIIYNKLFDNKEGIECYMEKINRSVITIEVIQQITKLIIDKYDDLLYKLVEFIPKDKVTKIKMPQQYQDILNGYLVMSIL